MSLFNYNINQQLEHYIDQFLTSPTPPSFSQLKTLLIARQPIAAIQAQIVSELTEIKNRAQLELRSQLEENAIQQQIKEDNAEMTRDERELTCDQKEKERLNGRLVAVTNRRNMLIFSRKALFFAHYSKKVKY